MICQKIAINFLKPHRKLRCEETIDLDLVRCLTANELAMGFLLLSVDYPSETHRTQFAQNAGPHSNFASPFHKFLAASATDDQWRRVIRAIRENVKDSSFLDDQPSPRPLKPNDDNYKVRNVICGMCKLHLFALQLVVVPRFFSRADVFRDILFSIYDLRPFSLRQITDFGRLLLGKDGNQRLQLQHLTFKEEIQP